MPIVAPNATATMAKAPPRWARLGARDYTDATVQASFTDEQAFKSINEGMKKDEKTLMKPSDLQDDDIKASVTHMRTFKK